MAHLNHFTALALAASMSVASAAVVQAALSTDAFILRTNPQLPSLESTGLTQVDLSNQTYITNLDGSYVDTCDPANGTQAAVIPGMIACANYLYALGDVNCALPGYAQDLCTEANTGSGIDVTYKMQKTGAQADVMSCKKVATATYAHLRCRSGILVGGQISTLDNQNVLISVERV